MSYSGKKEFIGAGRLLQVKLVLPFKSYLLLVLYVLWEVIYYYVAQNFITAA